MAQITTHIADAKTRLLQQYKGKPLIEAVIDALGGNQIQDIEDDLTSLLSRLVINSSEGVQLDEIGEIVGQPRNGQNDVTYRIFLLAKIGRNVSEGDIERVISVWNILAGATSTQVNEIYPAEIELFSDSPLSDELADIAFPLMQDVVGAGIRVISSIIFTPIVFGFNGDIDVFGFDSVLSTGQNTSVVAFKLIDGGADFVADGVIATNEVVNVADNTSAIILTVNGPTELTLDTDIFTSSPLDYDVIDGSGGKLAHVQGG